jgi:hypothetical protein
MTIQGFFSPLRMTTKTGNSNSRGNGIVADGVCLPSIAKCAMDGSSVGRGWSTTAEARTTADPFRDDKQRGQGGRAKRQRQKAKAKTAATADSFATVRNDKKNCGITKRGPG